MTRHRRTPPGRRQRTYSVIGHHCYDQNRSQRHDQGHIHSNWITAIWPAKHGNHAMIKTREAHEVCPYSNATRGNIPVTLTVA
jgi:hypothetical protein